MEVQVPHSRTTRRCSVCRADLVVFDRQSLHSLQGRPWFTRRADLTDLAIERGLVASGEATRIQLAIGECAHCGHAYYAAEMLMSLPGPTVLDGWVDGSLQPIEQCNSIVRIRREPLSWLHTAARCTPGVVHQHLIGPFEVDVVTIAACPVLLDNGVTELSDVVEHVLELANLHLTDARAVVALHPVPHGN